MNCKKMKKSVRKEGRGEFLKLHSPKQEGMFKHPQELCVPKGRRKTRHCLGFNFENVMADLGT